jgi:hypothetical protein
MTKSTLEVSWDWGEFDVLTPEEAEKLCASHECFR